MRGATETFLFLVVFPGAVLLLAYGIGQVLPPIPTGIAVGLFAAGIMSVRMRIAHRPWMNALREAGYQARIKTMWGVGAVGIDASTTWGSRTIDIHVPPGGGSRSRLTIRTRPTKAFPSTALGSVEGAATTDETLGMTTTDPEFGRALLTPAARTSARCLLRTVGDECHRNEVVLDERGLEVNIIAGIHHYIAPPTPAQLRLLTRAACALADEADRASTKQGLTYEPR